jgi:lactate dehydrogenase-like 2-hydroxyacid dehydrogenase
LVNVGRSSVIDEDAITAELEEERLGGCAADVFAWAWSAQRSSAVSRF